MLPKKLKMPLLRDGLDPVPALGDTRDRAPVSRLGGVLGLNIWLVSGYEQTREVLNDTHNYSSQISALAGTAPGSIGGLGFADPPEHTRLRALLISEFTGRRLTAFGPRIEQIINARLDAMESGGEIIDFVSEFAFPVPFTVICELLGLPFEDRDRFQHLGAARFDVNEGGPGTFGAMSQSRAFLLEAIGKQRIEPGNGLIGNLIRAAGDQLDDTTLAGLADGVFTGGYETSASMLALGTLALLQNDGALGTMSADIGVINNTVEELLRYLSVVQVSFPRFARHDMRLSGSNIKAGDAVVCSLSGANRDPVFGNDSDRLSLTRPRHPHLAFGHGLHRCIGAELARMELRIAFGALAQRFPEMTLAAEPDTLAFRSLSIVYGIGSLPVRLRSSEAATA
jgi:cytochrome P450